MAFDYPNSPTVGQLFQGLVWDGEKWVSALNPTGSGAVRYDMPQGLGANQMAQGRANISVTKKNYILNGAMMVSQENGTTVGNTGPGIAYYPVDQFTQGVAGTSGAFNLVQVASPTAGGSPNRVQLTVSTADAAVGAGDVAYFRTRIEGLRAVDLSFGTAAARTVTVQFGVKAPAGTYCVILTNGAYNRSYVAEYVIAAGEANTNVIKSVTIPGDTAGTWATDNTLGIEVRWGLMAGTTFQQAAGSWGTGNPGGSPNQFNWMGIQFQIFELFDVSLTEGSIAPPFQVPDYATELALCMRYYQKSYDTAVAPGSASAAGQVMFYLDGLPTGPHGIYIKQTLGILLRAAPTVTLYSPQTGASGKVRDQVGNADVVGQAFYPASTGFTWTGTGGTSTSVNLLAHYAVNARL